jgi:excisionase family DNA binding protein
LPRFQFPQRFCGNSSISDRRIQILQSVIEKLIKLKGQIVPISLQLFSQIEVSRIMSNSDMNRPAQPMQKERLAYSLHEAAEMLGVNYYSIYRLVQRRQLKACRALRGKFLIPRAELLRLLEAE